MHAIMEVVTTLQSLKKCTILPKLKVLSSGLGDSQLGNAHKGRQPGGDHQGGAYKAGLLMAFIMSMVCYPYYSNMVLPAHREVPGNHTLVD